MLNLELRVFGVYRNFCGEENKLIFNFPKGGTLSELKEHLIRHFELQYSQKLNEIGKNFFKELIFSSVIATAKNARILSQDEQIVESGQYAVLPPVCGG